MKTMKTTMQNITNWKTNVALLVAGLTLGALIFEARGGKGQAPPRTPMCVVFDNQAGDRIGGDGLGPYCDSEADVSAASTGGFGFRTDETIGPRKLWLDFQNPIGPVNGALVPPPGLFEVGPFWLSCGNDANGISTQSDVTGILTMLPGQQLYAALMIDFTDGNGGVWKLSFGEWCGGRYVNPRPPVRVTALADVDGDGYADSWRMEPAAILHDGIVKDSWGYLQKKNKKQQLEMAGIFYMPFGLVFTKQ